MMLQNLVGQTLCQQLETGGVDFEAETVGQGFVNQFAPVVMAFPKQSKQLLLPTDKPVDGQGGQNGTHGQRRDVCSAFSTGHWIGGECELSIFFQDFFRNVGFQFQRGNQLVIFAHNLHIGLINHMQDYRQVFAVVLMLVLEPVGAVHVNLHITCPDVIVDADNCLFEIRTGIVVYHAGTDNVNVAAIGGLEVAVIENLVLP